MAILIIGSIKLTFALMKLAFAICAFVVTGAVKLICFIARLIAAGIRRIVNAIRNNCYQVAGESGC